jgi:hypothetical protein
MFAAGSEIHPVDDRELARLQSAIDVRLTDE